MGKVRAYNRDVVPGRIGGLRMASEDRGPYRLRTASVSPYMGAYGYGRRESFFDKLGAALAIVARVVVATLILSVWLVAVFLYRDTSFEVFGIGTARGLQGEGDLVCVALFVCFHIHKFIPRWYRVQSPRWADISSCTTAA